MATHDIDANQATFDRIASEIVNAFGLIIEQAVKRRDQLLTDLNKLRIEFENKIQSQIDVLNELEQMRAHYKRINIKQNFLLRVQEAALAPIEEEYKDLKRKSYCEPELWFECPLIGMIDNLKTLGAIIEEPVTLEEHIDYLDKVEAKRIIGRKGTGNGEFIFPLGMHITNDGQLYVVDRDNKRIQVFEAHSGEFLFHFGHSYLSQPNGITGIGKFCYVTDPTQNKIFQFNIEDHNLVRESQGAGGSYKNLKNPAGITVDNNGTLIYVTDFSNNRVCIFDSTLKYVSELGVGKLEKPIEVKIYSNNIFVLDESPYCLHTFDEYGNKLRSILSCGRDKQVIGAVSFCLDVDMNIIVSDFDSRTLKVFSQEGNLLHRIGKEVPGTEIVGRCFGVILKDNNIFLSCHDPFHSIKIF